MPEVYAVICEHCGPIGTVYGPEAVTAAADQHVADVHGGPAQVELRESDGSD